MKEKYEIKIAEITDIGRWLHFLKIVKNDFFNMDLSQDELHVEGVKKNIKRKTVIYIENDDNEIIGAMMFSPNQNHISWLAVHPDYRRLGIATALVKYMFKTLSNAKCFYVKTFIKEDKEGIAARAFYRKMGFIPGKVVKDMKNRNAGHSMQEFTRENI